MSGVPTTICSLASATHDPRCTGESPSIADVVSDGVGAALSTAANLVKAAVDIDTYIPIVADPYLLIATDVPARHIFPTLARTFAPTDEQYAADLASVEYSYLNPALWFDQPLHAAHSFSTSFGAGIVTSAAIAVGAAPEAFGLGVPAVGTVTAADLANFSAIARSRSVAAVRGAEAQAQAGLQAIDRAAAPFEGVRPTLSDAHFLGGLASNHGVLRGLLDDLSSLWWEAIDGADVTPALTRLLTDHRAVLASPVPQRLPALPAVRRMTPSSPRPIFTATLSRPAVHAPSAPLRTRAPRHAAQAAALAP
ncbi:MAG: hypothetical protein HY465_03170 [Deltaproteobacteria bacterium]|nr:hypothetical protein [Deltaproteobacteria bacterium]